MEHAGQWDSTQLLGRRWPIGCVALEVTQRCNLDCTLCYLSDMSEAVHDLPLPEIFRRIDAIVATYGPGTGVQVTGGDPTLRRRDDLLAIVSRLRERGLRPSLFTNGIRATRPLLAELAAAGLRDVAFHVDTTQQRKGYATEADLNPVRRDYIARARGLPLAIFFNTTVHDGNFDQIPDLVRFFVAHSEAISVASFQMQADTGRGVQQARSVAITRASLARQIAAGAGAPIPFLSGIGHHDCNLYAVTLTADGQVFGLTDDSDLVAQAMGATAGLPFDHTGRWRRIAALARHGLSHPRFLIRGTAWAARTLWRMRGALLAAKGRVHRLSYFIHDFMDADHLDPCRIEACAFMVATADGPISMCLHNAARDSYITKPIRISTKSGDTTWDPLMGEAGPHRRVPSKGRRRIELRHGRSRDAEGQAERP